MDTLGHADAPAACIVVESSRRAGPSAIGNASGREKVSWHKHLMNAQRGNPVRKSAGTKDLMSARLGFYLRLTRHSWEIRDAGKILEDPDSASKRQRRTTKDEDTADIEEYVEYPSAHWMVQLSG